MSAGQPYDTFWDKTPREIDLVVRVMSDRLATDQRLARIVAYETAVLMRTAPDKFPKPEQFLDPGSGDRVITDPGQMDAVLRAFAQRGKPK